MPQIEDIVCWREGEPRVSIPQAIVKHSSTGYAWGYGGSGPADLALNILARFIGRERAEENGLYQLFKWDFIAPLPYEGGVIRGDAVRAWLADHGITQKET